MPAMLVGGVLALLCVLFTVFKAVEFFASSGPAAVEAASQTLLANSSVSSGPAPVQAEPAPQVAPAPPRPPVVESPTPAAPPVAAASGERESDIAARARAAASTAGSRDTAGKVLSTADIVAESEPSVALIRGKASSGTGFLVAPNLMATNSHVIDDEFVSDLEIRFVSADDSHKTPLKAELLYEDPERDLAFLAVRTDLKPLRVARTYAFRKGEDVTVIGSPGMGDGQVLENAISRGVMSTKTQIDGHDFYQLGIAINPGNSGGPVFDSAGRVIGVATLKSSKQEAMGFCIPVEDLQKALGQVAAQKPADSDRFRSRHRVVNAVKALASGGAILCLIIDLRRAAAATQDSDVQELLGKLENAAHELDKDVFPSLAPQVPQINNDPMIHPSVRSKVTEMATNFQNIHQAYLNRGGDDNQLRPWKQNHRRLLTELSTSLKLEIPKGMMVAFDDHAPSQPSTAMVQPPSMGAFGSRYRGRFAFGPSMPGAPSMGPPGMPAMPGMPTMPGMPFIPRPPSLRDRMPGRGIR